MRTSFLVIAAVAGLGCIVPAPTSESGPTRADRPAARPIELRSGANFGDKLELTSVILGNDKGYPGEGMRMLLNLKVLSQLDADYMVFVHVEDVDGRADRLNVDHAPARGAVPTSKWEVGQTIRDEFEVPIPPGMNVRGLNVLLGFWDPKTDARLSIKNGDQVRHDGRDRLVAASFPVVPQL